MLGYCESVFFGPDYILARGWLRADLFHEGAVLIAATAEGAIAETPLSGPIARDDLVHVGAVGFQSTLRGTVPASGPIALSVRTDSIEQPLCVVGADERRPFPPRGYIDHLDGESVHGWVFDPAGCAPRLSIDGLEIELPLNLRRDDLPEQAQEVRALGFAWRWQDLMRMLRGIEPGFVLEPGDHHLALLSSGIEIDARIFSHRPALRGRIERVHEGLLSGWAVDGARSDQPVVVELLLDGVRYATGRANQDRADLSEAGIAPVGGGYSFPLPPSLPNDRDEGLFTVEAAFTGAPLPEGSIRLEGTSRHRPFRSPLLHALPRAGAPGIAIIVPIHRAAEDVARCLAAIERNTSFPARLILIDDASGDPAIDVLLNAWRERAEVHVNDGNLGFTRTVNKGIALAGRDDVVLLNSDTVPAAGWLEGLRLAAYSDASVGTATAVSNNAGAFSVPEVGVENRIAPGLDVDDQARRVRQASLALFPLVPTGNGFCLYIRRDCLDAVGPLDEAAFPRGYGEENDFCMRAWRRGFLHVVDDRTFVFHRRGASFGAERTGLNAAGRAVIDARYPEYEQLTQVFEQDFDLLAMRWRLRRAAAEATVPRPRALFVISTRSGGTPQTNADLMAALSDRYESWVLRCDSRVVELSRWTSDGMILVESRRLDRPIHPIVHRSGEYDVIVADLLLRFAFEIVHIRHIAWHGIGLPAVCRRLGIPVVFSFHDFYTVCPTTKLLDERMRFCGGICTEGPGECVAELWPRGSIPGLKHGFVGRWREMMGEAIAQCDAFVTTSSGARALLQSSFPLLEERDFRIIPHARDFPCMERIAADPAPGEPLRVLVPGNISPAKGASLIEAVADLDLDHEIEFHVLGDPGRIRARPNVILHGRYDRDGLVNMARAIRPHIGAILSIWPETYSHTLTEMWAAGLGVLALDLGAVGERIREQGGGWLLDPETDAPALLEALRALGQPEAIVKQTQAVLAWQRCYGRAYDTKAMAADYDRLYRSLWNRRRVFAEAQGETPVGLVVSADTGSRLGQLTRNHVRRPLIYRHVGPEFAWESARIGRADLLLVEAAALMPDQAEAIARKVADSGAALVLDATGWSESRRRVQGGATARLIAAAALLISAEEIAGLPTVLIADSSDGSGAEGVLDGALLVALGLSRPA